MKQSMNGLKAVLMGSVAITTLGWAGLASAQTAAPDAVAAKAANNNNSDVVVVVTAQRRSETLAKVAMPVTAVTADTLARVQAQRLEDYAATVPGLVTVSSQEGSTQIIMRGITSGTDASPTVATYVDDAPYGSSTIYSQGAQLTPDLDPSDLQRLEVLRGPQGTLYGATAMGGLVKYVTTPPNLTAYHGRIEVDGTEVDHGGSGFGGRAMINVPLISDVLGLRISGYDRKDPGFIDDPMLGKKDINDVDVSGGQASLLWKPTDKFSARFEGFYQETNSHGTSEEFVDPTTLKPLAGDLTQNSYAAQPLRNKYSLYTGTLSYDFGWATLTSSTSYSKLQSVGISDYTHLYGTLVGGILGIPNYGVKLDAPIFQDKSTEEVRLVSAQSDVLDWQAGVFVTQEHGNHHESFDSFNTSTGSALTLPVTLVDASLVSRFTEYAGYGDVTWKVTSKFNILAGVRFSHNDQVYSQPTNGILLGGASDPTGKSSDDSTTFLLTPSYQIDNNQMAYVRIASGYRPGGPNGVTLTTSSSVPPTFGPDSLTNYEAGYKGSFYNHRLYIDLSAFHIDWKDIQLLAVIGGVGAEVNGSKAVSQGLEAQGTFKPISGLTFSGNFAYTDAKLTANAPSSIGGEKGDRLPGIPKLSGGVTGDYNFELTPLYPAFVGFSYRYVGSREQNFAPPGTIRTELPSYSTVDLRTGVLHDNWTFELYAKNVGDERGIVAVGNGTGIFGASVIQPETVGFSLSSKF